MAEYFVLRALAFLLCLIGMSSATLFAQPKQIMLLDFEEKDVPASISPQHAQLSLATAQGVTHGKQALQVSMQEDYKLSGIEFHPDKPIDASSLDQYSLVFDATNLTERYSAQIFVTVRNTKGQTLTRSAVVPVGETKTFFFELAAKYLKEDTGLRDDPNPRSEGEHMKIHGLKYNIDFSKIDFIRISVRHAIASKTVVFDNVRLEENPPIPEGYLEGIVDRFGQYSKRDFPGKISSEAELKALADEEVATLQKEGTMEGRGRFGGWSAGPKLEATGFFRTEKVGDKWALVDPEGFLFFSNGIANVRMANTTSFTGRDFKDESVRYRDPEDVTPEDSRGMVDLSKEVTETSYIAYPFRYKMFQELPSYDSPLANHFSYRREQHIGPFEHGETFSFYQANLERRYGEVTPGAHLDTWVDITLKRFLNWGFTSFGNWAAVEFYEAERMPYFANGWIIGDFKTVRSGMDYWGPMPDVFDPEFERRAKVTVGVVAEEVQNSPWCIGVFIDNEKSWGVPGTPKGQYGIVLDALSKDAANSPIKAEYVRRLKVQYGEVANLNQAWGIEVVSWEAFAKGIDLKDRKSFTRGMIPDFSSLLEAYATRYFQVVHDALAEVLPNHLYMGCRFASWGMGPEVRAAAKKYVDVFSYNYYEEAIGERYWKFLDEIDRPSIIGEFHMGAMDGGLFHPGLVHASNQADRARMYQEYMYRIIDNPYFVGAHWFQYLDSPLTGRAHDGENYNVGFVRNTDVPYKEMVEAAKEVNRQLYKRRFGTR